ncbi:MAG TPA: VTT domain-containing protein [Thermomicrobiaceae bacterium]|nr:VTT domain-containing protein [Thermomicrobiaceae bacterium]
MAFEPEILRYGVPLVAVLVMVNETGLPTGVPLELVVLLCGALVVHSLAGLLAALAALVAGDVLGTTAIYLLARVGGSRLLGRGLRRFSRRGEETLARWRERLGGHDRRLVFVGRSLPLVRMYVSIGAGLLRVPLRDFLLGAVPGAIVWAGTPLALGYLFRAGVDHAVDDYAHLASYLVMVMPALAIVAAVWWLRRQGAVAAPVPARRVALAPVRVPSRQRLDGR